MQNFSSKNRSQIFVKFLIPLILAVCPELCHLNDVFAEEGHSQNLQELMLPVIKAYRKQDYAEALKRIELALQQIPEDPSLARLKNEIELRISDQYRQSGDMSKARDFAKNVLANPAGGLSLEAEERLNSLDSRPKKGFHGYISSGFEYNSNVASSIDPGNIEPTNTSGYGSQSRILIGYQGHIAEDYYWDVWGEALPTFWKGAAEDLDWQQYNTGLLTGVSGDLWDLSLAYKFSSDIFDSRLNRIRHGAEATSKFWLIPKHWQTFLTVGVFFDEFRLLKEADATYIEVSLQNYIPFYLEQANAYGYVYGGYTYLDNDASTIFEYYGHRVNLALFIPTSFWSIGIQTGGWLERRNYDQPNPVNRRDTIGMAYLEIVKEWALPNMLEIEDWSESIQTKIGYNYIETQSSVKIFNKIEHVFRFTISYHF